MPDSSSSSRSTHSWRTVISFLVSVPVLSEQITDVLPSVSTIGSRRTSACRLTMRRTPIASEIVTTAGSASGTTATASAMPNMNMSMSGKPRRESDDHHDRHHHERRLAERRTETIEVLLQRRAAGVDALHHPGDLPELGRHAGRDHEGPAASVGGDRAGIHHVAPIADRQRRLAEGGRRFFDRHRFAGERGLVDREIDRLQHTRVGRHAIAHADDDHVSRHQLARGDDHFLAVAHHACRRRGHFSQGFERPAGTVFLNETEHDGEQDDDGDDRWLRACGRGTRTQSWRSAGSGSGHS